MREVAAGNLRSVVSGFIASPEFAARQGSLSIGKVATDLYRSILDRNPDPGGLEGTESLIRSGLLAERTAAMVMSDEYRNRS